MIVLDTDVVTLLAYGKTEKLRERIAAVEEGEELAITIVTQMEILQGRFATIRNAADQNELKVAMERFRTSEEFLAWFSRLDADDAARDHFERLRKAKKTKNMRRGDMLNACIALANNAVLVTRNVKDYKDVPGLRVENWAD
jgi:predicted nucleic acid-binding protein